MRGAGTRGRIRTNAKPKQAKRALVGEWTQSRARARVCGRTYPETPTPVDGAVVREDKGVAVPCGCRDDFEAVEPFCLAGPGLDFIFVPPFALVGCKIRVVAQRTRAHEHAVPRRGTARRPWPSRAAARGAGLPGCTDRQRSGRAQTHRCIRT